MDRKTELLAPAGSLAAFDAALCYGADAIYVGGELLQLRAPGTAFSREALADAIKRAHARGVKVYVTLNALARNEELLRLGEYGRFLCELGADAAIVSDAGVLATLKQEAPALPLHISTQASVLNYAAARLWHELGAERIVLAREMRLTDIAELRAKTPADLSIEAFVHGAMCMAYSGRCLISAALLGRSGNRGDCAQPCRWNYSLMEEKRPNEFFPIEEEGGTSTLLSSCDLNCIGILPELRKAGVDSFKIEGRMKTEYYVAVVTNAYRMALDGLAPLTDCAAELDAVSHRPYTTGFYLDELPNKHANDGAYIQKRRFAATVVKAEAGMLTVRQRAPFQVGDSLELVSPGHAGRAFPLTALYDTEGAPRSRAPHPLEKLRLPCPYPARAGDLLRVPYTP